MASSTSSNSSSECGKSSSLPRFGDKPSLPAFPDTSCYDALMGRISKNSIRGQLKKFFDQLEDIQENDSFSKSAAYIDGMQKLMFAVAKSIKAFIPFLCDDQLFLEVSSYAFFKMSKVKQAEFNTLYDRKSLFNILRFLRNQIVIYYENFTNNKTEAEILMKGHNGFEESDNDNDVESWIYCIYCRSEGHTVHLCPTKRSMLCFKVRMIHSIILAVMYILIS